LWIEADNPDSVWTFLIVRADLDVAIAETSTVSMSCYGA